MIYQILPESGAATMFAYAERLCIDIVTVKGRLMDGKE